jgi:hypothetical protein
MEILFFFHVRSEGEEKNLYRQEATIVSLMKKIYGEIGG